METIEYKGFTINVRQDEDPMSPQEYGDKDLFLVHYHRDFWIDEPKLITQDEIAEWYRSGKPKSLKGYWIFAVSALIHSSVWLSLNRSFVFDPGGWDTSHVGAILVNKKSFRLYKLALKATESLLEEWNTYLSGNVYGYEIEDQDGNTVDGCWGFYGHDYCLNEAKAYIDWHIEHNQKPIKEETPHPKN